MEKPSLAVQGGKAFILLLLAIVMLFPFIYVIAMSFSSRQDVLAGNLILFPAHPTLDAYSTILQGGIVTQAVLVSIGITGIGVSCCSSPWARCCSRPASSPIIWWSSS